MEALKKLRRFSCAKSCKEKVAALGMRCDDFSRCDDCAEARARAASALLDEVEKRLVPEGMEWPRFEDGEPVRIGDRVQLCNGHSEELCQVHMGESYYSLYTEASDEEHLYGTTVNRPNPPTPRSASTRTSIKTPASISARSPAKAAENAQDTKKDAYVIAS